MKTMNERQLATVLAALRYWQRTVSPSETMGEPNGPNYVGNLPEAEIFGDLTPLDAGEIDALCDELNVSASEDPDPWVLLDELANAVCHLRCMGGAGGTEAEARVKSAVNEAAKHVDCDPIE